MKHSLFTEEEYQACREKILQFAKTHIPSIERLQQVFPYYGDDYLVRLSDRLAVDIIEDLLTADNTLLPAGETVQEVIQLVAIIRRLSVDIRDDLFRYWMGNSGLNYFNTGPLIIGSKKFTESQIADAILDMRDENLRRKLRSNPIAKTFIDLNSG